MAAPDRPENGQGHNEMRDLDELELNEGGNPVKREPPTEEQVCAFEAHFGVKLPEDYLRLLRHSNGGGPYLDAFVPHGQEVPEVWGINQFHYLNDDREGTDGVWWQSIHRPVKLGPQIIPVADNGGGDKIVLNFAFNPPKVQVWVHEAGFKLIDVADSFGEFIDMLHEDPDVDDEDE